jgi:hypothetical protein
MPCPRRRRVGDGARDQHVVDQRGQLVEEPPEPFEVGGVGGRDAGSELNANTVQAIRFAVSSAISRMNKAT